MEMSKGMHVTFFAGVVVAEVEVGKGAIDVGHFTELGFPMATEKTSEPEGIQDEGSALL